MKIEIGGLTVPCVIGDLPEEREKEQPLVVDAALEIGDGAAESDRLSDTVDYSALAPKIAAALKAAKCRMIERAAKIAWDACMSEKNAVSAKVRVTKKGAVPGVASATAEYSGAGMREYELAGIETIARGICIVDGKLLVCRSKGGSTSYLPGGHIEFGETGRDALRREMLEETGLESKAGEFRGVVESRFMQHGKPHAEINLVYSLEIPSLGGVAAEVVAKESWIEFAWVPIDGLDEAALLPEAFRRLKEDRGAFFAV